MVKNLCYKILSIILPSDSISFSFLSTFLHPLFLFPINYLPLPFHFPNTLPFFHLKSHLVHFISLNFNHFIFLFILLYPLSLYPSSQWLKLDYWQISLNPPPPDASSLLTNFSSLLLSASLNPTRPFLTLLTIGMGRSIVALLLRVAIACNDCYSLNLE